MTLNATDFDLKAFYVIRSIITYLFGSTPDDFSQVTEDHPFEPCPNIPNCAIHSVEFDTDALQLFIAVKSVFNHILPYKVETNSQSLQIDAVFRITVFGFKDDVQTIITPIDSKRSMLHIRSSRRFGRSDIGVNRRRIKRILSLIHH